MSDAYKISDDAEMSDAKPLWCNCGKRRCCMCLDCEDHICPSCMLYGHDIKLTSNDVYIRDKKDKQPYDGEKIDKRWTLFDMYTPGDIKIHAIYGIEGKYYNTRRWQIAYDWEGPQKFKYAIEKLEAIDNAGYVEFRILSEMTRLNERFCISEFEYKVSSGLIYFYIPHVIYRLKKMLSNRMMSHPYIPHVSL